MPTKPIKTSEETYLRVIDRLPHPSEMEHDCHFYGFELETAFWDAVYKRHREWKGEVGLLVEKRDVRRLVRFWNRYGGRDDVWLYDFMLQRTAEAPQYMPRPMTEEEELDAMLYDIFGFDWWKED